MYLESTERPPGDAAAQPMSGTRKAAFILTIVLLALTSIALALSCYISQWLQVVGALILIAFCILGLIGLKQKYVNFILGCYIFTMFSMMIDSYYIVINYRIIMNVNDYHEELTAEAMAENSSTEIPKNEWEDLVGVVWGLIILYGIAMVVECFTAFFYWKARTQILQELYANGFGNPVVMFDGTPVMVAGASVDSTRAPGSSDTPSR